MRVLWISANAVSRKGGGGTTYADGLQRALALALPRLELIEAGSPGKRRSFPTRVRRHMLCLLRSLFTGVPTAAIYHRYSRVAAMLSDLVRHRRPDLAVFDSADSIIYRDVAPGPAVLIAHNVESDIIAEKVRSLPLPFRALLEHGFNEVKNYREFERAGIRGMQAIITISATDRAVFEAWLPDRPVVQVLPCFGPEAAAGRAFPLRREGRPIRVVFPAKFSWAPNRRGIDWFIDAVWPSAAQDAELHLFGEGSEAYADAARRIVGHGFVPDVADIWREADVSIVPTFSGSGLNVKMCEALYHGVPVITTPLAVERLGFEPPVGIRTCEDADAWRSAVSDARLRAFASQRPRLETSQRFSDEAAAATLQRLIVSLDVGPTWSAAREDAALLRSCAG